MLLTKQLIDRFYEELIASKILCLTEVQKKRVLVFTNSSISADNLRDYLSKNGVQTTKLHSKMKVNERIRSLSEFKEGKHLTMVATDVGARGLDF
jgi:superfamily II DNA/RNA helicase